MDRNAYVGMVRGAILRRQTLQLPLDASEEEARRAEAEFEAEPAVPSAKAHHRRASVR